ncbi:MAG: PAC2 family protein [Chloroflexi bacterium]|nr:PAC2 family protein [Chloroflexota bacterium]
MRLAEKHLLEINNEAALRGVQEAALIAGWNEDAGGLGLRVIDYLGGKLGAVECARIELPEFFPLSGVAVENDVIQFPETRFSVSPEKGLIFFKGHSPRTEWYRFLNTVLEIGEYCRIKELYTIGGMVSMSAHTAQRDLLAVANSPEMKAVLAGYNLASDVSYETPPHQRPTLSSYLLWVAQRRNVPGISLWAPTPFYLVSLEDPQAWKRMVEFFNDRFALGLDLADLDEAIIRQNENIARVISAVPEIDHYIWKLERNLALTEEENQKLVKEMEERLGNP